MNPRYLAYCRAHEHAPHEQRVIDENDYPGGRMAGFMIWLEQEWLAFEKQHVKLTTYDRPLWRSMHSDAFDVWLTQEYP